MTVDSRVARVHKNVKDILSSLYDDPRLFNPGVRSHLTAAEIQLVAVVECLKHDQVRGA